MKMKKIVKAVTLAAATALFLSGCSVASIEPDQAGLHYKGGSFTSTHFANCIDPGSRAFDGPGDKHFAYPAGQRTFDFSGVKGADSPPIVVSTHDNIEMKVLGVVTFNLDQKCEMLKKFHEQIGLKYAAYTDGEKDGTSDGWDRMLNVYLGQPLQRAMNEATQATDWKSLYNDSATKGKWEAKVAKLLPTYVAQQAGEDYFVNFKVTIQKPEPPAEIVKGLQAKQAADLQNQAQEAKNQQVVTELDSIQELVKVLGVDGYLTYKAIQDGRVSVMPIPQGAGVNLNPPAVK